ncbi:hypothetical protein EV215_1071 [Hypnocyclicus thermotrophus]|uniref:UPF0246 protein EV215_1071 n=1 Tax=Hypnocyclicus thermotrophus TaxID=1627895 RepID=A0AA46DYN4_9FUSO|nr:YaaA family protein [Hypnocyclicus thermotrophus]TDT70526.1 hypothetical protein EV215_1071 [Hypnocyclicus thermotrophus]
MFIIFSPSKGMNFNNKTIYDEKNKYIFQKKYEEIYNKLKEYKKVDIANIMKIKNQILENVYNSLHKNTTNNYFPAILAYNGIAYKNLDIKSYDDTMIYYLNQHLLILSALYGINKPYDLISYYRLDMTMKIFENMSLYKFWKDDINKYIEINSTDDIIINLASKEFSKLINRKKYKVIDIEFKELSNGKLKSIATNSKKMRGTMLDFMIKNKIKNHVLLKEFNINGYSFSYENSKENVYIFIKN